ncbi:DNA-binding protein [Acidianus sulfidivorans JP7]|uniref:DNA-binding protein n=1 Tax=Acidianus sulfidivorans JP7 TaxID=619593 RepID=A0A2U9IN02_9CREN|nr:winged helix-turn-helix domain-containing protein [Acidianus sulfidivorans]AWR97385.1 DNA-binding protein [Acidianus sulfidivorans JP7]
MRFKFKIWIEDDNGNPIIGKGGIELIKEILKTGSIAKAADNLNMSYKFAWEYSRRIEGTIGGLEPKKGGKNTGGTIVSDKIQQLIEIYDKAESEIQEILDKYSKKLNELNDVK